VIPQDACLICVLNGESNRGYKRWIVWGTFNQGMPEAKRLTGSSKRKGWDRIQDGEFNACARHYLELREESKRLKKENTAVLDSRPQQDTLRTHTVAFNPEWY